ncbi:MAG: hypothetical protein Q9181_008211, partial [Wetmoreana brouardii]
FLRGIVRGYKDNPLDAWILARLEKESAVRSGERINDFWQPIVERLVLNLSGQQLLFGISILIAGYLKHCSISVYHFIVVHVYLKERPTLRNWRVYLMLTVFMAMIVAFVPQGLRYWTNGWKAPAQCLFDDLRGNVSGTSAKHMAVSVVFLIYGYSAAIYRLFETESLANFFFHTPMSKMDNGLAFLRGMSTILKAIGGMNAFLASMVIVPVEKSLLSIRGVFIVISILLDSHTVSLSVDIVWFTSGCKSIFNNRAIPAADMEGNEDARGFGQIVPVLLLSSVILTFKELYTANKSGPEQKEKLSEQHSNSEGNDITGAEELSGTVRTSTETVSDLTVDPAESEPAQVTPLWVDTEAGGRRR